MKIGYLPPRTVSSYLQGIQLSVVNALLQIASVDFL